MIENIDYKKFNLAHAKLGAPVITISGVESRIICFDIMNDHKLIATYKHTNGKESLINCKEDGTALFNSIHNLVMKPLFTLDNKGVFFGDTLWAKNTDDTYSNVVMDSIDIPVGVTFSWERPVMLNNRRVYDHSILYQKYRDNSFVGFSWRKVRGDDPVYKKEKMTNIEWMRDFNRNDDIHNWYAWKNPEPVLIQGYHPIRISVLGKEYIDDARVYTDYQTCVNSKGKDTGNKTLRVIATIMVEKE